MSTGSFWRFILLILFSTIGSVILGYFLVSKSVFEFSSPDFQFISNGVLCGLFFGVMELKSLRTEALALIGTILLNLVIFTGPYIAVPFILRDIFYLGSVFLSIKTYYFFISKYPSSMLFIRSFALSFIYGIFNVVIISLLFLINKKGATPTGELIYFVGRWACLIGLGSGLGIDLFLRFQKVLLKPFIKK